MEPQGLNLKDYLETLLTERNDRLMGGVIKHFGNDLCPSDLCYKEVLPSGKTCTPTPAAEPAAGSCPAANQPSKASYQSCTAEAYQNYALNALKNLANGIALTEGHSTAKSENCAELSQTAFLPEKSKNANCPQKVYQEGEVYQTVEIMQVNILISQQLERIEKMIREMYITNQELFKSIITYCQENTDD